MTYHAARGRDPRLTIPCSLPLIFVLAACRPDAEEPQQPGPPPRPETRQGVLMIEGMEEPSTFRLFESPRDFPVAFSTYVPEDVVAEASRNGDGASARFIANFAGQRNDLAVLHFYFFPEHATEAQARAELQTFATARGVPRGHEEEEEAPPGRVIADNRYDWALEGVRYAIDTPEGALIGHVSLGWYRDRFFQVVLQHPEEWAEGFVPRAEAILRDWRWEDTGEPLGGPGALPRMPPPPDPDPQDVG
jgi:hypothetical protein